MARASYGPEAKKRSRHLLQVLLDYANDEIDGDEAALEGLRSEIQTRWQDEHRLIVRTKVRFLQALTGFTTTELTAEQIKEALKRFADFVGILEDNRPSRSGSEIWHFTLNLWYKRQDTAANLQKFDREWEIRRPEKSREVMVAQENEQVDNSISSSSHISHWQEVCRANLNHRLTTNPLTSADGVTFDFTQIYVPLGLVQRKQRLSHRGDVTPQEGSRLYEPEDSEVNQTFDHDEFIQQVLGKKQSQRIAIIGEPGAGKTTLLQKIATWVLENTSDLPVWVSLADLQGRTLDKYLIEDWLPTATRKLRVASEIEEEFCEQFNQGRVYLLLDAVDEMAMESTSALAKIAGFLKGWVADATIILTCRLNVWDAGKNALENFDTYCNLHFTYGEEQTPDRVGQFISRWFQHNPNLAEKLQCELNQPERRRIRDVVKNPLRLALLCRIWGMSQGILPQNKAMLYEQFVDAIYEWKQDCFSTTSSQRQELNQALGELALLAIAQEKTKFRLRYSFVCQVLGAADDGLFQLALQLGWLNQVGVSEVSGEKVYAFYHPTFQEYFAARAVNDWRFFLNHQLADNRQNIYRIVEPQWREVILLWLGRHDVPQVEKAAFMQELVQFRDGCGGFYEYQAYFLAAQGIAEFTDCQQAHTIVQQLIKWRFGYFHVQQKKWWRYPSPIIEGARIALLKTDRHQAIAALEQFITSNQNEFESWNAAYSLGRVFDPGNKIAIATLENLVKIARHETIRWQVAYSLCRVDTKNLIAITALREIIETTKNESTKRKAAYSLGKIEPKNAIAMATLIKISESATDISQRRQAEENLATLRSEKITIQYQGKRQHKENSRLRSLDEKITTLIRGISSSPDEDTQRRRAYKLAQIDLGNTIAFNTLLHLLKSTQSASLRKRTADNLKETLTNEQLPQVIVSLKDYFSDRVEAKELELHRDFYKLMWYCAANLNYQKFYQIWHSN
ncbi:NACHT domain-containing protein [Nostoc sp. TCL26-01]|uniref:NACHT domain-containing protein n=1 Tax=Nostoc sp. TCL26-01 TaxID=2576904 RepID=UPI0015BF7CA4|nr:NACHT domain-containing protein [Nostoc sp. TCL26-01]QLE59390.1 NACHT domain-containing protein [Nostoc sp. TCL26-01]